MKRIYFGYNNSESKSGAYVPSSWEGIFINPNLQLHDATFFGFIDYDNRNYLVAKVTDDRYNRYPELLGKFIVREALCDLLSSGACELFLDQKENIMTVQLQNCINENRDKITDIDDVIKYTNRAIPASNAFKLAEMSNEIYATSILTEEFNKKREALKRCCSSMSTLQMEKEALIEYKKGRLRI